MSMRGALMKKVRDKAGLKTCSVIIVAVFALSMAAGSLPISRAHADVGHWKGAGSLPEVGKMVNQIIYPTFGNPSIVTRGDTLTVEWDWRFGDATANPAAIPPQSDVDDWKVWVTTSVAANVQHYDGSPATIEKDWYRYDSGDYGYGTYENPVHTVVNSRQLAVTKIDRAASSRWPVVFEQKPFPVEEITVSVPRSVPFDLYDLHIQYLPDLDQVAPDYRDWAPKDTDWSHDLQNDQQPHALQVVKEFKKDPNIIQITDSHVFGQEVQNGGDGTGNLDYNSNELREPRPGTPNRDGLHGAQNIPLDTDGDGKKNEGAIYLQEQLQEISLINPDFVVFTGDSVFTQHNFSTFPNGSDYLGSSGSGHVGSEYRFEYPWWYEELLALNVPIFLVPGNHDGHNWDKHTDTGTGSVQGVLDHDDGQEIWQDLFGPLYYSWDYGNYHFLGINTMDWDKLDTVGIGDPPPAPWNYGGGVGGLIAFLIPEFNRDYKDRSGFLVDLTKFIIPLPLTIITPHKWHGQVRGNGDTWDKNPLPDPANPPPAFAPDLLWGIKKPDQYSGELGWIRDNLKKNMGKSLRGAFMHHDPFKLNSDGKPDMWENPDMFGLFTYPGGQGEGSQALVYLMRKYKVAFEASGHAHSDWVGGGNGWYDGGGEVVAINTAACEVPVAENGVQNLLTPGTTQKSNKYGGFRMLSIDDGSLVNWGFAGTEGDTNTKWSIPGWAGLEVGATADPPVNGYLKYRYNRPVLQWMEQDNGYTTQDPDNPEIQPRNEVSTKNDPLPGTFNRKLPLNDKNKGGPYNDVTSNVFNTLNQTGAQLNLRDCRIEFPMKYENDKSYYQVDYGEILEQYNTDSGERMVVVETADINGGQQVPVRVHKNGIQYIDNEPPVVDRCEINNGADVVSDLDVKLVLEAHDVGGAGMMDYRVSNDSDMEDAEWMLYEGAVNTPWTLDGNPDEFGRKSVYVQFRDAAMPGNVTTRKVELAYDVDGAPRGSILINRGDETTKSTRVTLVLKAEDVSGVKSMKVSNKPDLSDAEWQDFEGQIPWTINPNAQKLATVYAQFKDRTGLASQAYSDSIKLASRPIEAEARKFYFAEGTTRPNFDSYICIQNPDNLPAEVKITYMKGDGSTQTQELTVVAHSRSTVVVKDVIGSKDDAAHDFSALVETTNKVDVVAERPMYFNYNGVWTGGHDVMGAPGPSPVFHFAEGTTRPNFESYFCIQNPTGGDAEVKITYMLGNGTTQEQALTVPKTSRQTVKVNDFLNGILGPGDDAAHDFSAKIESTLPIVAERPMYFNYNGAWTGGHDVVGLPLPSSPFDFAEGTTRPNFDSYLCIQNPDTNDAAVQITYMLGDGTTQVQTLTVPKTSRQTVKVNDFLNGILGPGDDAAHDFSAKVETTNGVGIIAERPMYFNYKGVWTGGHDVVGYDEKMPPENPTVFDFAEGTARPNFDSYICIQNRNSTDAQVRITYMLGNGELREQSVTVPRTSRKTVVVKDLLGSQDDVAHDFSVKVESTNGVTILAERPMYFNYNGVWTGGHDVVGFPVTAAP